MISYYVIFGRGGLVQPALGRPEVAAPRRGVHDLRPLLGALETES